MSSDDKGRDGTYDELIGRAIHAIRTARGMTQSDLARVLSRHGLPMRQQTIVKIEKGSRPLRLEEAQMIATALGVGLDSLTVGSRVLENDAALLDLITRTEQAAQAFIDAAVGLSSEVNQLRDAVAFMSNEDAAGRVSPRLLDDAQRFFVPDLTDELLGAARVRSATSGLFGPEGAR